MKKVLFDLECSQPNVSGKFHGGGEYTKSVFEYLVRKYNDKCDITAFYNPKVFCEEWVFDLIEEYHIKIIKISGMNEVENILREDTYDVLFCGLANKYIDMQLPEKTVKICTLHGLRTLEYKNDKYSYNYANSVRDKVKISGRILLSNWYKNKQRNTFLKYLSVFDKIVCVSKHSYYSIKIHLPEIFNKVQGVFYPPCKHAVVSAGTVNNVPDKFILMISGNRQEKNGARAIYALDEMYSKQLLEVKTVITGNVPNKIRNKIKNKGQFILLDYVSIEELEVLYARCDVFFYPTLNEGFGIPPEEAMKYGKTCVVSAVCSLPEIYGDAVYYVNPYDLTEMKNRIVCALDEPLDTDVIQRKLAQIRAKQTADIDSLCKMIAGIS